MSGRRTAILFTVLSLLTAALFTADLLIGSVAVALRDIWAALTGGSCDPAVRDIILKIRLLKAVTALFAGAALAASGIVVPRPPALCQGCGHRDMYTALTEVAGEYENAKVFSDIGCYTLGWLSPFHAIDTCVDMGASITMAKGAADAGQHPALAVIGDSTFTHSGMTGLLDAVNEGTNITVVISDNLTTGMTGGQDSAGTGRLEQICAGLGVDPAHIRVVVPLPRTREEMKAIIREEIAYDGVSVIIPRRECIQTAKRHNATKQKQ